MADQAARDPMTHAASPTAIPARGWWQVALRVKANIPANNISIVAAGVAFYGFLAIFPMIGAIMTVFGLIADPSLAARQMQPFQQIVPSEVYDFVEQQVKDVSSTAETQLSLGLVFSLLMTLWSATKGFKALLTALNIAYEEPEKRGFIRLNLVALGFTLGGVAFAMLAIGVIALIPVVLSFVMLSGAVETAVLWVRWPVIAGLLMAGLAFLYSYGPNRRNAKLRWITPGAVLAVALWLLVSIGFSYYVTSFGSYDKTFGSLGAIVVLLLWLYLSAFVVCIGAELNAELELQTDRDTTVGPRRPKGQRGAFVADHTAYRAT